MPDDGRTFNGGNVNERGSNRRMMDIRLKADSRSAIRLQSELTKDVAREGVAAIDDVGADSPASDGACLHFLEVAHLADIDDEGDHISAMLVHEPPHGRARRRRTAEREQDVIVGHGVSTGARGA